jgi:uncharacterized protein (DUF427 family)
MKTHKIVLGSIVIAESSDVIKAGRECYFPRASFDSAMLIKNNEVLHCPDKGYAVCYDVVLGEQTYRNLAWEYPHPYPQSAFLGGRIGVRDAIVL